MATENKSANIAFLSIEDFKLSIGMPNHKGQVVKNPNTEKLFLTIGGKNFKCQGTLDMSKPLSVLVENGDLEQACLINVPESDNVVGSI